MRGKGKGAKVAGRNEEDGDTYGKKNNRRQKWQRGKEKERKGLRGEGGIGKKGREKVRKKE